MLTTNLSIGCWGLWQTCSRLDQQFHSCPGRTQSRGWVWHRWRGCAPPLPNALRSHWATPRIRSTGTGSKTFQGSWPWRTDAIHSSDFIVCGYCIKASQFATSNERLLTCLHTSHKLVNVHVRRGLQELKKQTLQQGVSVDIAKNEISKSSPSSSNGKCGEVISSRINWSKRVSPKYSVWKKKLTLTLVTPLRLRLTVCAFRVVCSTRRRSVS